MNGSRCRCGLSTGGGLQIRKGMGQFLSMPNRCHLLTTAATLVALAQGGVSCSAVDASESGVSNGASVGGGWVSDSGMDSDGVGGSSATEGGVTVLTDEQADAILGSACNAWSVEAASVPAKLEFIVDVSESMQAAASGGTESQWVITREALRQTILDADGTGLTANTAVGVLFYPGSSLDAVAVSAQDSTTCLNLKNSVPMAKLGAAGTPERAAIGQALDAAVTARSRPTHDAYSYALNNVINSAKQQAVSGTPYVVLLTDGRPTLQYGCYNETGRLEYEAVPTQPIIDEIATAASQGIKTFVIGLEGSTEGRGPDGYDWLSAAARVGGTAVTGDCSDTGPSYCHADMTKEVQLGPALRAALAQVTASVKNCAYALPAESSDGSQQVDVSLISPIVTFGDRTMELVGLDATGACESEGYRLHGTAELEFCPVTCARVQADPSARVQFVFGCGTTDIGEILM